MSPECASEPPRMPSHVPPTGRGVLRKPTAKALAAWEPVIFKTVGRFVRRLPPNVTRDDLLSAARVAVWNTLQREPQVGSRYMFLRVQGAILDELRAQDWLPRRARQRLPETRFWGFDDLERPEDVGGCHDDQDALEHASLMRRVEAAVDRLPPRERFIIRGIYFEERGVAAVARDLRVSDARVSQMRDRAVRRLRPWLQDVDEEQTPKADAHRRIRRS